MIYERIRNGKTPLIILASVAVIFFLLVSDNLVKELGQQERDRMDIWAHATERLAKADVDSDYEFLLSIISQNSTIPVLITDENFNISEFRNFPLPDKSDLDKSLYSELSPRNQEYLQKRLRHPGGNTPLAEMAKHNKHFIEIELAMGVKQYIYYEDSTLLKRLSWYPYVQLTVMIILVLILYFAVVNTKRAEQNRVWVGLSKETAHQLGTPISSLMAWVEYFKSIDIDPEISEELNKDVKRLSTIADRFSKIGSKPDMQLEYINQIIASSLDYMKSRVSNRVQIRMHLSEDDHGVYLSRSLFEWVMENLTKNAVDAMQGEGCIDITTGSEKNRVWIEVKDTGKGIARKHFKTVFKPGYTTKKRGWGLGLTLVKRIVEEYHGGRIFVKESEPGSGTTFRIEFPSKGK
ncbi:MAG: sensor histidine kinase [Lepagella sp.]